MANIDWKSIICVADLKLNIYFWRKNLDATYIGIIFYSAETTGLFLLENGNKRMWPKKMALKIPDYRGVQVEYRLKKDDNALGHSNFQSETLVFVWKT